MGKKNFAKRINANQLTMKDQIHVIMGSIANAKYSKTPGYYYNALEALLVDYMPRKVIKVTGKATVYEGFYNQFAMKFGEECEIIEREKYEANEYNITSGEMDYKEHFCFRPVNLFALYSIDGNRIVVPIRSLTGKYSLVPCEEYAQAPQLHVTKKDCVSDERIEKDVELVSSGKFLRREDTSPLDYWPIKERNKARS